MTNQSGAKFKEPEVPAAPAAAAAGAAPPEKTVDTAHPK
jgi:hypothetical protein